MGLGRDALLDRISATSPGIVTVLVDRAGEHIAAAYSYLAAAERQLGLLAQAQAHTSLTDELIGTAFGAVVVAHAERLALDRNRTPLSLTVLTPRERRVLPLLRGRATLPEIATELHVSLNTVKSQTKSIYRKLGVASKRELIDLLDQSGHSLLDDPRHDQ